VDCCNRTLTLGDADPVNQQYITNTKQPKHDNHTHLFVELLVEIVVRSGRAIAQTFVNVSWALRVYRMDATSNLDFPGLYIGEQREMK
jgi:hypothetical protein